MRQLVVGASRTCVSLSLAIVPSACASHYYSGIDLRSGRAPDAVQAAAREARAGKAGAMLELARRFEIGDGVQLDLRRAISLYMGLIAPSERRFSVYQPPIGALPGQMIPVVSSVPGGISRLAAERLALLLPLLQDRRRLRRVPTAPPSGNAPFGGAER